MPASSKKKTSKTAAKKSTSKKATKKTKPAAAKSSSQKTTKKTAAKKTATKKPSSAKTSKKSATKKAASKSTGKPIRLDYLIEKLTEAHGTFDEVPPLADTLDVVLFAQVARAMPFADAKKAFLALRTQFVDWNEVRISPVEEVQEALKSAEDPPALTEFLQSFLMRLFLEQHHVGLEFLREKTNAEIKSFFKPVVGIADSTVGLVLERLNEYPVVPLEAFTGPFLERIGIGTPDATLLARQKDLYEKIDRDQVLGLSLQIQEHAQYTCPVSEEQLDCPDCVLKRGCPFPEKVTPRQRAAAKKKVKKSK